MLDNTRYVGLRLTITTRFSKRSVHDNALYDRLLVASENSENLSSSFSASSINPHSVRQSHLLALFQLSSRLVFGCLTIRSLPDGCQLFLSSVSQSFEILISPLSIHRCFYQTHDHDWICPWGRCASAGRGEGSAHTLCWHVTFQVIPHLGMRMFPLIVTHREVICLGWVTYINITLTNSLMCREHLPALLS
jgi:hypothetical protein